MAGHTAPVHRATLNCVVPKKLGLFSYEQAYQYQPLRIGSFQREAQLWDVAPPSDENRSRGDGLDKSQLASGCSIKKKKLGFFRTQLRGQNHLLTLTPTYQIPDATQR